MRLLCRLWYKIFGRLPLSLDVEKNNNVEKNNITVNFQQLEQKEVVQGSWYGIMI